MKVTIALIYLFLFAICFLISALLWHAQMQNVFFVTPGKGAIADFIPPFVHPGASGDFYIRSPQVVYTIWAVYFGCVVLIPAVCSWLILRLRQRELRKVWM